MKNIENQQTSLYLELTEALFLQEGQSLEITEIEMEDIMIVIKILNKTSSSKSSVDQSFRRFIVSVVEKEIVEKDGSKKKMLEFLIANNLKFDEKMDQDRLKTKQNNLNLLTNINEKFDHNKLELQQRNWKINEERK